MSCEAEHAWGDLKLRCIFFSEMVIYALRETRDNEDDQEDYEAKYEKHKMVVNWVAKFYVLIA